MKRIIFAAFIALISLNISAVMAQDMDTTMAKGPNFPKMDASPLDLTEYANPADKEVMARVIYSRPQKRDREIFGKLVPYGEVWRTGANEATELTLYKKMKVAGEVIDAGTYTIYTIPNENEWTVILNNRVHTWGAYEYTDKEDLVRIKVPVKTAPTNIEAFSMAFVEAGNGANLLMGWDNKYVEVPFTPVN